MSLELRNGIWHLRYRVDGVLRSESTHSRDQAVAEALDKKRAEGLIEHKDRRRAEAFLNKTIQKEKVPARAGVYFIHSQETGLVKIGFSSNARGRLRGLSTMVAGNYETIALVECSNYVQLEGYLHRRFRRFHVKGEWFNFPGLELAKAIVEAFRKARR